jgi:hypothetical protein
VIMDNSTTTCPSARASFTSTITTRRGFEGCLSPK